MTASDKTKDGGSHTPGPWGNADGCIGTLVEGRRSWTHVATVVDEDDRSKKEAEANARLIAAAPDLLEAALAVEALWEGDRAAAKEAGLDFDEEQAWASPVGVVWKQLRAAIAKATTAAETVSVGMKPEGRNAPALPTGDA